MSDGLSVNGCLRLRGDGTVYLEPYAWPGGYPILYIDDYGNVMCPNCATKNLYTAWPEDAPTDAFIHWEGPPEICACCDVEIESVYGDPDNDENEDTD